MDGENEEGNDEPAGPQPCMDVNLLHIIHVWASEMLFYIPKRHSLMLVFSGVEKRPRLSYKNVSGPVGNQAEMNEFGNRQVQKAFQRLQAACKGAGFEFCAIVANPAKNFDTKILCSLAASELKEFARLDELLFAAVIRYYHMQRVKSIIGCQVKSLSDLPLKSLQVGCT